MMVQAGEPPGRAERVVVEAVVKDIVLGFVVGFVGLCVG